jgi:hypothetical protein
MMKNYEFPAQFRTLYSLAVKSYANGVRSADQLFTAEDNAWLAANGITPQHMYDYAEDHNNYAGDPGFEHALAIEIIRRDYFRNIQHGHGSRTIIDESKLPPKDAKIRGVAWLPRLLPKAKAKLHGELPPSLMYCCGGDRKFFKEHNVLPAEFLSIVWRNETDENAVVDWVIRQRDEKS